MLDELAFLRASGEARGLSVLDGRLVEFCLPGGEIQGGLFSTGRYAVLNVALVMKELKRDFPEFTTLLIADDVSLQVSIDSPQRLE
eukprot:3855434-Prymnesium_polylepis.1